MQKYHDESALQRKLEKLRKRTKERLLQAAHAFYADAEEEARISHLKAPEVLDSDWIILDSVLESGRICPGLRNTAGC